ncbi:transcription factor LHW-like [Cornus florida]|uniref:transcription factor LHW-like n=1 Tax=Cornus florida TaxID=4283 RepID=UPI0028A14D26|nr:transcription factor LHW-like [Cornus florida]
MGATPLRQFLQSLCHNSHWNYAVFWKLQQQSSMLLTWEDGYCDCLKPRESMGSILGDICFKESGEIFSFSCESNSNDGRVGEYPIELAVADMSRVQYALGEGVIHEVAYTGNHCWLFCDNISAGEFNSKLVAKSQDEWQLQFLAGIKTILLVPVVPHGVLQLGSLEMVAEDLALVANIKDNFNAHQIVLGYSPSTSNGEFLAQSSSSSMMSVLMDNLDVPSTTAMNEMNSEYIKAVDSVKPKNNKLSTADQMMPQGTFQDAYHISEKNMPEIFNGASEYDINVRSMCLIEVSKPLTQSVDAIKSEMTESNMFRFSGLEEELQAFPCTNNCNVREFGEYAYQTMISYSDGGMMEQPFLDKDSDNNGLKIANSLFSFPIDSELPIANSLFSFPIDSELHKALGPSLLERHSEEKLCDSSVVVEDTCGSSSLIYNGNLSHGIESSAWESIGCFAKGDLSHGVESSARESIGCFAKGDDVEHLLDAVVANVCSSSDDFSSNMPNNVKLTMTSSGQFAAASSTARSQSERTAFVGEGAFPRSGAVSAFAARDINSLTNSTPSASSFESMMSTLIEEQEQQQQKEGYSYTQSRKGSKILNASKRRARHGDNHRPRPRDRQLIQDRVKELRELVPDGAKCSIDGLLDRTIKHMLFLRSVTDQADKLRQWVHQEVTGEKNVKSSESKGGHQGGTSWAFELGSELQVCPIVVEDLECPGHMLIEMLCNDHGFFLEIADVIRRLELNILKGVMKTRSDKTWAHFIVEASKDFHRLDIFWPLMQLLQRNQCSIPSKI